MSAVDRDVPRIIVDLSLLHRLALAGCYLIMVTKAYAMMLLVMTYNYPVLIMLCAGLGAGHLIFSIIGLPELPYQYK